MPSWFTTKKVEGSATLSEKLAEVRKERNIDLDTLSDKTKISKKFLVYLEDGRLDKLPAEIYAKGFLKKLADFYKIDTKDFLRLYEQEDVIRRNIDRSQYPPFHLNKSPTFIITPRTITAILAIIAAALFIFFFSFQLSFIIKGPEFTIDSPENNFVSDTAEVLISGTVSDPDAVVSVNGEAISLKEGRISEMINLNPGVNIIEISATNKFKRTSTVTRQVVLKTDKSGQ